ncbi:hypothetical protein MAR_019722 [Mya arenaria]|uniref:Endonuclease/exonuclease/phosphatase domain-containing protein n=1 Tax=Mya arenaria TaxID=6604 RepID=A0ABY7E2Y5_MYAAR|nr:hypothetical protein MAR_019722 [Mya arenaria]
MGISETKFNENHKTETFHIDGYQVPFRRDRLFNGGGGLAVYVKQNVNCIRRLDLEGDDIEIIWLEIMPTKCKSFLIGSLYRHPESKVAWKEIFDTHIENVQLEEKEIIILGDINRDLLISKINDEWSSYILSLGLKQLIKQPTRECSTSKTLIDHIYTNCDQNICNVSVPKIGISDHYPILCTRKLNYKEKINSHNFIKYRSFRSFSEESFLSDLIRIPWGNLNNTDTNEVLHTWVSNFSSVVDNHVPIRIHRVKHIKQPDWFTPDILDEIKKRDKFKAKNDMDNYRVSRNKVCTLIDNSKKESYKRKIEEGKSDPKTVWKIFKEHGASTKKTNNCNLIKNIHKDGIDITDNQDIANTFNKFFVNVAANLKEPIPTSNFNKVNDFVKTKVPDHIYFHIPLITESQTRKMLNNLDVSKATGLDQIGPTLLKLSADVISNSLTYVINCSIKQGDKILGIYINENLKWDTHIKFLRKKISSNLWLLSRIKVFIPVNYRIMFYKAYVQPHLDYCSIIWGSTKQSNIQVLVRLQRRACRIILGEQYTTLSEALNIINSLNIEQRVSLHKAKFMYRVSQNAVPSYIQNMFNYNVRRPNHLRSSNKSDFLIPKPNIELFKGSMSYSGVKVWNNIPNEIRQSESIKSFTVNYTKWINSNQQS